MNDVALLEALLRCQQMRQAFVQPCDDENETDKYLRWAIEATAKRMWWANREIH